MTAWHGESLFFPPIHFTSFSNWLVFVMTSLTQKSQGCSYNERIVQHNLHVKPDLPPTAGQHDHNSYRGSYRVKACHPVKFNSCDVQWARLACGH